MVGAAAFYGSVTKTMSAGILIFELTGQVTLIIPVALALGFGYLATSGMTMSIFDVLLEFKNFPFMPTLGSETSYQMMAKDIMNKNFFYISEDSRYSDIPILMRQLKDSNFPIPVVNNKIDRHILYTVLPQSLKKFIEEEAKLYVIVYYDVLY